MRHTQLWRLSQPSTNMALLADWETKVWRGSHLYQLPHPCKRLLHWQGSVSWPRLLGGPTSVAPRGPPASALSVLLRMRIFFPVRAVVSFLGVHHHLPKGARSAWHVRLRCYNLLHLFHNPPSAPQWVVLLLGEGPHGGGTYELELGNIQCTSTGAVSGWVNVSLEQIYDVV